MNTYFQIIETSEIIFIDNIYVYASGQCYMSYPHLNMIGRTCIHYICDWTRFIAKAKHLELKSIYEMRYV